MTNRLFIDCNIYVLDDKCMQTFKLILQDPTE